MKTHATTPRDELLGMGPLALGRHYDSCQRKLDGLGKEKDYAVAESEVRIKKAKQEEAKSKNLLDNTKNSTAQGRSEVKAEKEKLMKEIHDLETDIAKLNEKYNAEFSAWWVLKEKMKGKVAQTNTCKCPKKKAALFQTSRHGRRTRDSLDGPKDQDYMYDTARKVEECETQVIKISDEIAQAEAKGRHALVGTLEKRKVFGKRLADQQHLSKLLDQRPLVAKLRKTKTHLDLTAKAQREKVEKYKKTNAEIQKGLEQLDKEMARCSCKGANRQVM
jgi:molybdenum-dependent DNA-binding transcriptional regulator ModE